MKQTLDGIKSNENNVAAIGRRVNRLLTYGKNHPFGEFTSQKTLKNISLQNVKDLYNNNFKPNNAYLIIMGDVDPSVNPEYLKSVKNESEDNCTLIPFENCGHYPSLEKPDEFIETMSFITSKVF